MNDFTAVTVRTEYFAKSICVHKWITVIFQKNLVKDAIILSISMKIEKKIEIEDVYHWKSQYIYFAMDQDLKVQSY